MFTLDCPSTLDNSSVAAVQNGTTKVWAVRGDYQAADFLLVASGQRKEENTASLLLKMDGCSMSEDK